MDKLIGRTIMKTANTVRRCVDRDIELLGLEATGGNARIINYLAAHPHRDIYQKDIEQTFSLARSTVSSVLSLMEKNGLIHREAVACDARLKKIVLTEKARALNQKTLERLADLEKRISRGFTPEEVACLVTMLRRIDQNLEDG